MTNSPRTTRLYAAWLAKELTTSDIRDMVEAAQDDGDAEQERVCLDVLWIIKHSC